MAMKSSKSKFSWGSAKTAGESFDNKRWHDNFDLFSIGKNARDKFVRLRFVGPIISLALHELYSKKKGIGFQLTCGKHDVFSDSRDNSKACPVEDNWDDIQGYKRWKKVYLTNAIVRRHQRDLEGVDPKHLDLLKSATDEQPRAKGDEKKSPVFVVPVPQTVVQQIQELAADEDDELGEPQDADNGFDIKVKFSKASNRYVCALGGKSPLTKVERRYRLYDVADVNFTDPEDIQKALELNGYYDGTYHFEDYNKPNPNREGTDVDSDDDDVEASGSLVDAGDLSDDDELNDDSLKTKKKTRRSLRARKRSRQSTEA